MSKKLESENDLIERLNEIREEIRKYGFDLIPINISIAQMEALNPDLEYDSPERTKQIKAMDRMIERDMRVEEEFLQDFTGVTIMTETEKAYLVVKNKYQMWVAKSNLQEQYELGDNVDLLLTEKAEKWLPNKSWEPFKPQKGGK